MTQLTVYFDGSCPLCQREIALLRRMDHRGAIGFEDVSEPGAAPSCDTAREDLMARFHARLPDGEMVSGARAFTESWGRIRGLSWLLTVGRFGPSRAVLEAAYRGFLVIRPALQWMAGRRSAPQRTSG